MSIRLLIIKRARISAVNVKFLLCVQQSQQTHDASCSPDINLVPSPRVNELIPMEADIVEASIEIKKCR